MTPSVNPDAAVPFYVALAAEAGVRTHVRVDDPRVAADVLIRSDGAGFAWLVSQADERLTITPQVAGGLGLASLDGTACDGTVTLDPFGVRVLRLTGML